MVLLVYDVVEYQVFVGIFGILVLGVKGYMFDVLNLDQVEILVWFVEKNLVLFELGVFFMDCIFNGGIMDYLDGEIVNLLGVVRNIILIDGFNVLVDSYLFDLEKFVFLQYFYGCDYGFSGNFLVLDNLFVLQLYFSSLVIFNSVYIFVKNVMVG